MPELNIPMEFSALSAPELDALEGQITTAASPLVERHGRGERLPDADAATLKELAGHMTRIGEERERRIAQGATERVEGEQVAEAAAVFSSATTNDDAPADEDGGEEAQEGDDVATPRVGDVAKRGNGQPTPPPVEEDSTTQYRSRLIAGPNLPTKAAGSVFAGLKDVAKAMSDVMRTYSSIGPGQYVRTPVLTIERNLPPERVLEETDNEARILAALDFAADESRLDGGNLVAAAAWCAPSENDYALMEIEQIAGILDLPTVQINRGGINFTVGPDFAAIFGSSGFFHQTEAQVQAATAKTCMVVPCPAFTDVRLEVDGVCITGAFLQDRGYPEMVARFVRGALVAHAHKLNIFVINKLVAGSTLFDYTNVANLAATTSEYKDMSALSKLLAVVGIQIMDLRYKYRMGMDATIEAVLPYWALEVIRADVQRRTGLSPSEAFNVSRQQVEAWFAVRGARVQWVYDWLDAYNSTNTSTVGQTAGVYTLPTSVDVLLYPAGTWVKGVADVVRLDNVYDSTNLVLNQYVRLFSEEGILVAKRGYESRRVRVNIYPSGVTGATADMTNG
jgi:hypothetical protein